MIEEVLKYNRQFVKDGKYESYITSKYPDKKLAILACMDTRLTELLPAALGLKNGDVKIIKNAGGEISNAFGSVIRSLLIAVYELGVEEILVIGHTDCGVQHMNSEEMIGHMKNRGITDETLQMIHYCGIDLEHWLSGFDDVNTSVRKSVALIREHPLMPEDIRVRGFVMDSHTGELLPVK